MFGIIRNIVIVILILSLVYAVLSFTNRARQRSLLKAEYKTQSEIKQITEDQDEFIARGMKRYERGLKPKLLIGVYLIPGAIAAFLIYLAQYT